MTKKQLSQKIYEVSHLTGSFLLRSGITSSEYFDKYQFSARPELLKSIAEQLTPLIPKEIDYLAGLEMGAIPIATALSLATGIPVVFVRKEAKSYGTCKFAEGPSVAGKRLLVIEDVITSGGQLIESTRDLRAEGAKIEQALCVILRNSESLSKLSAEGIQLQYLFTKDDLTQS